jgi:acylphosphatase
VTGHKDSFLQYDAIVGSTRTDRLWYAPAYAMRRNVFFSGRVQGVGFRAATAAIARRFEVRGFVRNLPDGRVELIAEGAEGELQRFLKAIRTQFDRHISDVESSERDATGEFDRFEIRY